MNVQIDAATSPAHSPAPVRLPKKWPHSVSEGDSIVKIYRESTVIRGTKYSRYLLSYFANGKRERRRFADCPALAQHSGFATYRISAVPLLTTISV